MGYWARTPQARGQQVLFSTTLDDVISDGHPVRLIGELLDGFDWTTWEGAYHGSRGKPPIHPRVLAGLWLYGLRRSVRSSRKLEYMARNSIDFLWLAEGHSPDHSTLSSFRLQFGDALKELFRHVLRVAMAAGLSSEGAAMVKKSADWYLRLLLTGAATAWVARGVAL